MVGRQLVSLLKKMLTDFQWEDVVKICHLIEDHLPSFRRTKKIKITKDVIDSK